MRSLRSLLILLSPDATRPRLFPKTWQQTSSGLLPLLLLGVPQGMNQSVPGSVVNSQVVNDRVASSQVINSEGNPFASRCPLLFKPLLEEQILPDLPSYVNRSLQRQPEKALHYLLGLSSPDYVRGSLSALSDRYPELELEFLLKTPHLHQVFLTSRERSYSAGTMQNFQQFHWLFFHLNDRYQWQLVAIFSQTENNQIRDSRSEALAQAIDERLEACWISDNP